jgi:hypothetical protein
MTRLLTGWVRKVMEGIHLAFPWVKVQVKLVEERMVEVKGSPVAMGVGGSGGGVMMTRMIRDDTIILLFRLPLTRNDLTKTSPQMTTARSPF